MRGVEDEGLGAAAAFVDCGCWRRVGGVGEVEGKC